MKYLFYLLGIESQIYVLLSFFFVGNVINVKDDSCLHWNVDCHTLD